jgi:four helix bundle protein
VWQESIQLVKEVYLATKLFPKEELFVLTSQIRRAAISIPSNIAEGYVRKSTKEFLQFIQIAFGSASELDTQIIIANKLGYLKPEQSSQITKQIDYILRMLNKLSLALKKRIASR